MSLAFLRDTLGTLELNYETPFFLFNLRGVKVEKYI